MFTKVSKTKIFLFFALIIFIFIDQLNLTEFIFSLKGNGQNLFLNSILTQFVHKDQLHFLINMSSFAALVWYMDSKWRLGSILTIYIGSLLFVALVMYIFGSPGVYYVGNSGAISGLYGAFLFYQIVYNKKKGEGIMEGIAFLTVSLFVKQISFIGHFAGLVFGIGYMCLRRGKVIPKSF